MTSFGKPRMSKVGPSEAHVPMIATEQYQCLEVSFSIQYLVQMDAFGCDLHAIPCGGGDGIMKQCQSINETPTTVRCQKHSQPENVINLYDINR
jgi:hypothetical protein